MLIKYFAFNKDIHESISQLSNSYEKGSRAGWGVLAKNPQIANLDSVDGGQARCLIYGGFETNAASASTVIQHLQKSPMLTSNMF